MAAMNTAMLTQDMSSSRLGLPTTLCMSLFSRIAKVKRRKHLLLADASCTLGADETRTRHFQIANLTLYQMSYGPRHLLY